jgi:predicted nuclease of predicted toxin-antitoxin system
MKLLLDQGLPRSTVLHLRNQQIEAVHVGDRGLATATDSEILDVGRQEGMVVVTLDADFHALLALSGVTGPSVIRIRIEGLSLRPSGPDAPRSLSHPHGREETNERASPSESVCLVQIHPSG